MLDVEVIETPENVELRQRLAGIGSRFIAGLLDNLIIAAVYLLIFLVMLLSNGFDSLRRIAEGPDFTSWSFALLIIVLFLIHWGYFLFFELVMNGQSPGKRAMRLRVVKEGGSPIGVVDLVIRNLLRVVDALPFGYGVGGVAMFASRKVQRLGDLAAGTVVIAYGTADYSANTDRRVKTDWERETSAESLRATGLTPEEYRALSNYWARRHQLTLDARIRILPGLLKPVIERTGAISANASLDALETCVEDILRKGSAAHETDEETTP